MSALLDSLFINTFELDVLVVDNDTLALVLKRLFAQLNVATLFGCQVLLLFAFRQLHAAGITGRGILRRNIEEFNTTIKNTDAIRVWLKAAKGSAKLTFWLF